MLIEKISELELQMIDDYRKHYGYTEDSNQRSLEYADVKEILQCWNDNKEQLYTLLGSNLTLTKELSYERSYNELEADICNLLYTRDSYGRAERNGAEFIKAYKAFYHELSSPYDYYQLVDNGLINLLALISSKDLTDNRYDGPTFEITDPANGKIHKISNGCKTIKALGKIAKIFNLPGFEDFRICHSQILNQKSLKGKLTLSIHPLDYMTMSDNENDWESCMNWRSEGGYRQGTIEMMNSPMVVVAYLSSKSMTMYPYGRCTDTKEYPTWNSKAWRELFIINDTCISAIKDYPYNNEELSKSIVEWLRELARENLGWEYENPIPYSTRASVYAESEPNTGDFVEYYINFSTGHMYNDFGALPSHWLCLNVENLKKNATFKNWNGSMIWDLCYSGPSMCVICGDTFPELDDESCLACCNCQQLHYCDKCGDRCSYVEEIDGMWLCEDCMNEYTQRCDECGEYHYIDGMTPIYVIPRYTPVEQELMREIYINKRIGFDDTVEKVVADKEMTYEFYDPSFWVCNDDCLEDWKEDNLIEGAKIYNKCWGWHENICVYYDDLTDEAKRFCSCGTDVEAFKKRAARYASIIYFSSSEEI